MKKFLVGLGLFLAIPLIGFSQTNDNNTAPDVILPGGSAAMFQIPLLCGDLQYMLNVSKAKQEELIFMGELIQGFFTFMAINENTRTYTILVVNKDNNFACLAAAGTNFQLFKIENNNPI